MNKTSDFTFALLTAIFSTGLTLAIFAIEPENATNAIGQAAVGGESGAVTVLCWIWAVFEWRNRG